MGSISSQAFKSTIFSYIGVVLGFFTVGYLFPKLLAPGEVGVIRLILNYSEIAARIAALGTGTIIIRYFAHFKDEGNKHNGFLSYMLILNVIGLALFFAAYYLFSGLVIEKNIERSPLFSEYFHWIIPTTISLVIFYYLDTFSTALKMSAIGIFFKDFVQRLFIAFMMVTIWVVSTPFHYTLTIYFSIIISIPVLFAVYMMVKKQLVFGFNHSFLKPNLVKEIGTVASFALLTGLGGTAVVYIDNIMINEFMGESDTGIYSTIFMYTALILIPSRGLSKIAGSFVADSFQKKDLGSVKSIYYKSCMTQFLPGFFIFIMLWVNSDFIFYILPEEYAIGKNLILILGIGNLFNTITGVNTQVIAYSPLHKFNSVFIAGLLIITVASNLIFIPKYGISGAAIATAISLLTFNTAKYILLWFKYGFQPFNSKYLYLIIIGTVSIFISRTISIDNIWAQSVLRTIVAGSLFLIPTLFFNISQEINDFGLKLIQKHLGKS